ncbi:AbrB/MazE/SpoVT family DNA-binding domain-containing protein [Pontibacillus marinus]|uniref:Transcriptional regulator/antitoxin, MazE n=1 Tax=Pontibacillus marinus BH030004 = DSM 16465 TaxID=1385511 RepID=A0A0A5GKH1_9BACI|nr:AbrB/MazE/SpoVT family DNA-binding domain-containing protein [Pontibacillus marinus]KGX91728.1 transcriptional regulator/antitoxin, MazE [Pontibacillus marinus BH030004 = DSM 16465]
MGQESDKDRQVGSLFYSTKVQKWGNSLGVRIPNVFAKSIEIGEGTEVEMYVSDQKLTIQPKNKKPTLEELLAQCKPENRHEEIDSGNKGKELL